MQKSSQRAKVEIKTRKPLREASASQKAFGPMIDAGASAYLRTRDLPKLIALWPRELGDFTEPGQLKLLAKLRSALRAERRRGLAGHWSYDLNRHLGLLSAYKAELAALRALRRKHQPNRACRGDGFNPCCRRR